ncbi:hypothetical protein PV04_07858 [Phialophora macrospora]|uniref:Myb-like domain-containing protein n=1 Tax=Phialophora macrospora TaxID=1851006 RepID=A0A0D2G0I1_9EURO|nr:hypothetical protein PV04_07858 [Phialophora macrospora]
MQCSDPLMTTYRNAVSTQGGQNHTCAHRSMEHPEICHNLSPSTFLDSNANLYSCPNPHEDTLPMPTNNDPLYKSWAVDGSRFGNTGRISDKATTQNSIRSRGTEVRSAAQPYGTSMFWSGRNDGFEDWLRTMPTAETPSHTIQSPLLNDPTLAPELSLDDMDLNAMLQTPREVRPVLYAPQEMKFHAWSGINEERAASKLVDEKVYDAGENWGYDFSKNAVDTPDILPSSACVQAESGLGFSDFDLGLASAQTATCHSTMSIDPFLPELPFSTGSQFEFLDDIPAFAMDYLSPTSQYREADASLAMNYRPQYPDPEDFETPVSSTPGLTSASTTPNGQQAARGAQRDTSKDALLVRLRQDGKSYKQIKETGGFEEAESTLRGRYRTLIKPKEARVRKPEWRDRDIQLLLKSVIHFSNSNPIALGAWNGLDADAVRQFANKVPWKQVAEWMEDQGTYKFGNSTVKKQYLAELKKRGAPV